MTGRHARFHFVLADPTWPRRVRLLLATTAVAVGAFTSLPAAGSAATTPAPAWRVTSIAAPSNFIPGLSDGTNLYFIHALNVGGAATDGSPITITDQLPPGFAAQPSPTFQQPLLSFAAFNDAAIAAPTPCQVGPPVVCTFDETVQAGERIHAWVPLQVPASGPPTVSHTVTVSGGGAAPASVTEETPLTTDEPSFGLQYLDASLTDAAGDPVARAGAHPHSFRLGFAVRTKFRDNGNTEPAEGLKGASATLPPGFIVNPSAAPRCNEAQLESGTCPVDSAVGNVLFSITEGGFPSAGQNTIGPLYNMVPPPGAPASLGFDAVAFGIYVHLLGDVDPANGYTLRAGADDLTQYGGIDEFAVDLWGDRTDPSHDPLRGKCSGGGIYDDTPCPVPDSDVPFLTMPSTCSGPLEFGLDAASWQGTTDSATALAGDAAGNPTPVTGCDQLDFDPTLEAEPNTVEADSPTGLDVSLNVPQTNDFDELATANLKTVKVALPEGMAVNPSAADGLEGCAPAEIGIDQDTPVTCPNGSKVGTVEIITPLLDDPLAGSVYLAKQDDNPFNSLLALYVAVDDPATGIRIKLAGKVAPDPDTGQLTATFNDNPQLPFSSFELHFKGGNRATLISPPTCGTYEVSSQMTPWSAADPDNPTPAETVTDTNTFEITDSADGSPCPTTLEGRPFDPSLSAGLTNPQAGATSPFTLKLTRPDGHQEISSLDVSTPPGFAAVLKGVPLCQIALAQAGQCSQASKVGSSTVGAGAGDSPFYVEGGEVFLAGPYDPDGAGPVPESALSLAISVPAVAGPFDLGVVNVMSAIYVNPRTAQLRVITDPIPQILEGIPLHVRDIRVKMDRPGFTTAPTNCSPMSVDVTSYGISGATATDSAPFHASDCGTLEFAPKLTLAAVGGKKATRRNKHYGLNAELSYPPSYFEGGDRQANVSRVEVTLPKQTLLDQNSPAFADICTRPEYAAGQCPASTQVGTASATSPLLDEPLSGPVYLKASDNQLPDLAADLDGIIDIDLFGRVDQSNARIRNTFDVVPDAPVSHFSLHIFGGEDGILVNANAGKGLCDSLKRRRIDVAMSAQNGDSMTDTTTLKAKCGKKKGKRG